MKNSNKISRLEEDNEPFVPQLAKNSNVLLQKVKFLEEKAQSK